MEHNPGFLEREMWRSVVSQLKLSPREASVAAFFLDGHTVDRSAELLGISPHTVRTHIKRIYIKSGARNRLAFLIQVVGIAFVTKERIDDSGVG